MSPVSDFTVLVVEDHDFQRRTILQILANLGVGSLLEAADGAAALTLLDAGKRPDIVVCDLDMPGMDGVELIRHVAERHRGVAVVFASGLEKRVVDAADRTARAYGVTVLGAVQKPLTARRLLAAIGDYSPPETEVAADGAAATQPTGEEVMAALARGELVTELVPIIGIGTGALAGAEALTRWPGHEPDVVDAAVLGPVPGAEEASQTLTSHLFDQACAAQRTVAAAGHEVPVSLKAPASVLADVGLPDFWAKAAAAARADPRLITILVAEEAVLAEDATVLDTLTRLRLKGFGVSLASGSGAITATKLERGAFGAVRIDAAMVAEAAAGDGSRGALESSLELARGLGLETEAAGCDSRTAWDLLAKLGCDSALGEFIAPPMPPTEVAAWARGWSAERGR